YLGDGEGGFGAADGNLPGGGLRGRAGLSLGDIDGDGRDELAWRGENGRMHVWSWAPGNLWSDRSAGLPASGPWQALRLHDMNRDGHRDVAAFGGGRFAVWLGDGEGVW
ncbi:MAG: hypothetical protein GWN07_18460, partial [Actinobacteria bacterium]|nr:VCBS repeat-containing protein [Actinomycetota bacterium]NIU67406.1 VCBS repeat-containing protein [Actinomycetota bacterium]NIW29182.1 hypothetical protein [Actinomycetota bacterium]NIX21710.1 hypothetical protein [Actinomycetota bacterium]